MCIIRIGGFRLEKNVNLGGGIIPSYSYHIGIISNFKYLHLRIVSLVIQFIQFRTGKTTFRYVNLLSG